MDDDSATLLPARQSGADNDDVTNDVTIFPGPSVGTSPTSKLLGSCGPSFGTFPSLTKPEQTDGGKSGLENIPEVPDASTATSYGERPNSRRSTLDWYQVPEGNVNLGYIDSGVRERRTSSNTGREEGGGEVTSPPTASTRALLLKKYTVRWYIIGVFSMANFMIGMFFSTWGPIANSVEFVFPFTDAHIAALSSLGLVGFIPMFPVYNWLIQKYGLRAPMLVGTSAMAIGGIFRCGSYISIDLWWLMFIGQAISSLSVAIQGTLGASLVAQWFPTEERVLATGLITLTSPLGSAASSILGPQIVRDHFQGTVTQDPVTNTTTNITRHDLYMDINIYLFSQMILTVLVFILTLVYFPPKPPLPPTASAAGVRLGARYGISQMIRNRDFWCFCIVASLPYGCFTGWIPLLEPNLRPLGYSQKETGLLSFISLTVGAATGICSGLVLSRLRKFMKLIIILLMVLTAVMVTWFTLQCWGTLPHKTVTLYVSTISVVVFLYVQTTAAVDLLCEVSYPVPENFLMTASQLIIVMIAILFLIATFVPGFVIAITNWILLSSIVVAIPLACLGNARMKRLELDSQRGANLNKDSVA